MTQKDFIISNLYPESNPGYNLFVFDFHQPQDFKCVQPIKIRFVFRPALPAAEVLNGYALVLTNKLVCVNSDGRTNFDSIKPQGFHYVLIFFHC